MDYHEDEFQNNRDGVPLKYLLTNNNNSSDATSTITAKDPVQQNSHDGEEVEEDRMKWEDMIEATEATGDLIVPILDPMILDARRKRSADDPEQW